MTELRSKNEVLANHSEELSLAEHREGTAQSVIDQLQQEVDKRQQELNAVSRRGYLCIGVVS